MPCCCFHTQLSWEFFFFFFPSSNTLLLNQFSVRFESRHSCSPLLAVQMKQWGIHCLAPGHVDIICWHRDFSSTCVSVSSHRDCFLKVDIMEPNVQTIPSCIYSASLLQTIHLWVWYSTTALVNLNTNLQSQSSSRLPDSSCNPDSWKESETCLLQTVPTGDCAKEQQQSIKHAVKSWTSAILLLCSFSLHILKVPLDKKGKLSKM